MAHSSARCSVAFHTTNNKATRSTTGIQINHLRICYDVNWGVVHLEQAPFCVSNKFPETLTLLGIGLRSQGWWIQMPEELSLTPGLP